VDLVVTEEHTTTIPRLLESHEVIKLYPEEETKF
jgi:hypothetical protein